MSCTGEENNLYGCLVAPLLHLDDDSMGRYLRSTDRSVADAADKVAAILNR
jgi:hypothetical protein